MRRIFTLFFLIFLGKSITGVAQNAPTGFTVGTATSSSLQFSWTDGGAGTTDFYVVRHTSSTMTALTAPSSAYSVGSVLAAGTVVAILPAATTTLNNNTGLNPSTQYFYQIWAHKTGGDSFNGTPLAGTMTTTAAAPSFSSAVATSLTSITVTFDQSITAITNVNGSDFTSASFTATGAALSAGNVILTVNTLSGTNFTCSDLAIAAGAVTGTSLTNASISGKTVSDGIAPTVTSVVRKTPATASTNAASVVFTVTFSENVNNLATNDFSAAMGAGVSGATITNVSAAAGTSVDVTVGTISGNGTLGLNVLTANGINDNATNALASGTPTGSNQNYTIDQTIPTVTSVVRKTPATASTNAASVIFTVTFSENVNNLATNDFSAAMGAGVSGATITNVSAASGTSVDVTVGTISGNGTLGLNVLTANGINDDVTNALASGTPTGSNQSYTIDNTIPTVTSVVLKTPATSPTNASSVIFTVTFSENVNNLATNDFSAAMGAGVSGATITNVSAASGTSVDVTVGTIAGNGTLGLNVLTANGINDDATNALASGTPTGSNQSYTIDQTIPTVTSVVRKTPATSLTNAASVIFTVTFSENVNNLATNDFSAAMGAGVSGATITNVSAASGTSVDVTVGTISGNGTLGLNVLTANGINDDATNALASGTPTGSNQSYTIDQTIPTVTSVVRKTPATSPTNAASVIFTVTFSENVNNLATNDFSAAMGAGVSGATITNVSAASGTSVDVTVGTISGNGTLGLNVLTANGINDDATNALASGTPTGTNQNYTIDQTIPTVTSVVRKTPATSPTNAASVIFTVTFSENVNNLATNDFSAAMGAGVSGATITNVSAASGTSVDVTVGTISGDGTLGLNVLTANGINDDATNALASGTPTGTNQNYTIDQTVPTVTSVVLKTPATSPTNAASVIFTVTFSENVNNLATNDFSAAMGAGVSGATITNVSAASGTSVDVTVGTISGNGTLGLNVLTANGINDNATNALASGTPTGTNASYTIDQTAPTAAISLVSAASNNLTTVKFRITFNEAINPASIDVTDFVLDPANTATGNIASVAVFTANTVFDVTVNTVVGNTDVLAIDLAGGQNITDVAGNTLNGTPTSTASYTIDNIAPTLNPDEMDLNLLGTQITMSVSEQLNLADGAAVTGFSVSTGTIASAIYSLAGNIITLTKGTGTWTSAMTVTYTSGSGNVQDLLTNPMATITTHAVTQAIVNLSAGAIFITSIQSDDPDDFSFVLLRDIPAGTQIKFTNNGWKSNNTFRTGEETLTWTADVDYFAGTEVTMYGSPYVASKGTYSGNNDLTFSTSGDQLLAYQGSSATPTFLAAAQINATTWDADATNDQTSALPSGLTASNYVLLGSVDDAVYKFGTAGNTVGTVTALRTKLSTAANWTTSNSRVTGPTAGLTNYTIPPDLSGAFTPANGTTVPANLPTLSFTYDANVSGTTAGATDIQLVDASAGNAVIATWTVGSASVNVSGATVTINPGVVALTNAHNYDVLVTKRLFIDADGNGNTAVVSPNWRLTADAVIPTVTSIVRKTPATAPFNGSSVVFTVTFSESVTGLALNDFSPAMGAGVSGATITNVSAASGTSVDVTVSTIGGNGTLGLNVLTANGISDVPGNAVTSGTPTGTNQTYTIDHTAPTVTSIVYKTPATSPTNVSSVVFTVTFSENVNGLATNDFSPAMGAGVSGATVSNVSAASGTSVDVTVNSIGGNGTLGLTVLTANGINDDANNALASGTPTSTNNVYTIDHTVPTVTSVVYKTPATSPTNASSVVFTVTFSEHVNALATNDFTPAMGAGVSGATVTNVSASSGTSVDVTVGTISGNGTLGLNVLTANGISDDATNALASGTPTGSNQSYLIDQIPPVVASIAISSALKGIGSTNGIVATNVDFSVNFTEANTPLSGIDPNGADFTVSMDPGMSFTSLSVTGAGTLWTVTVNGITGTGKVSLGLVDDNTILDAAGNPLAGASDGSVAPSFGGTQYYTIALPEPAIEAIPISIVNATTNSVTISWTGTNTAQIPTHFLVLAAPTTGGTYPPFGDATYAGDAALVQNIPWALGTLNWTFSGLNSGTNYTFKVYKYTLAANNSNDNVDFEMTTPGVTTKSTTFASISSIDQTQGAVPISSILNTSGAGVNVLQFKIFDDGQDPIFPNAMYLSLNGLSPETITFNLREDLTLAEGASVTGFSTNGGPIASAIYTGKGTTNTITLTSVSNLNWNSATTISYDPTVGNATFSTMGKMQKIVNHIVLQLNIVQTLSGTSTYTIPNNVNQITVEAWGAGGSGGEYSQSSPYNNASSYGGGGGAYARSVIAVSPGNSYGYSVGIGGSAIASTTACCVFGVNGGTSNFGGLVLAEGGYGALTSAYPIAFGYGYTSFPMGFGGQASNSSGDFTYSGGNGGIGSNQNPNPGGGGGSSAGTSGPGNDGLNANPAPSTCLNCTLPGGAAPVGGGSGGTGTQSSNAGAGGFPGGGGGGVGGAFFSGAGANGKITVTYDQVPSASELLSDDAPFKFTTIKITQGTGNSGSLSNWQNIIAGAELSDGTTTVGGTVNPTDITFTGFTSAATGNFGFVPDAGGSPSFKSYTLKVWLRSDLTTTMPAVTVDGLSLGFMVDPTIAANITYDDVSINAQSSSRLIPTHPAVQSGAATIDVAATGLAFATQPLPASQLVLTNFTTSPVVKAVDKNGNVDVNVTGAANNVTITNVGSIAMNPGNTTSLVLTPSLGIVNFPTGASGFQYTDAGNGTLLATKGALNSNTLTATTGSVACNPITVSYFNATTIAAGTLNNTTITSIASTPASAVPVFDFKIVDDGGPNLGDGAPTRISQIVIGQGPSNGSTITDWTQVIQGAILKDNLGNTMSLDVSTTPGAFTPTTITFSSIPNTVGTLGYVADDVTSTKTYTLSIYLKNPTTIPLTLDNLNLTFGVDNVGADMQVISTSSTFAASQSQQSTLAQNTIKVYGTQMRFITNISSPQLPLKDINLQQTPVPQLEVVDANGNRDLDFTTVNTISVADDAGIFLNPGNANPISISAASGLITFPNNFQFQSTSLGVTVTVATGTPNAIGGLVSGGAAAGVQQSGIDVQAGQKTLIANGTAADATFSSIVNTNTAAAGINSFNFDIKDDSGLIPTDPSNDGLPTLISSLTITANNPGVGHNTVVAWNEAIAGAELWDNQGTPKKVTASSITANSIVFTNMLTAGTPASTDVGYVTDDGTKSYTLKIWLKNPMPSGAGTQNYPSTIDGLQFEFQVLKADIVTGANSTLIVSGQSATSGNKDVVDVTATQLDITTPSTASNASINTDFPGSGGAVVVQARDHFGNLDKDFNGKITSVANAVAGTMTGNGIAIGSAGSGIQFGTTAFSSGMFTFPTTFQFTSGSNGQAVTLTVKADNTGGSSGVTCGTNAICADPSGSQGISPVITLTTSFESSIQGDPTFTTPTKIPYSPHQESTLTNSSYELARVVLVDGSRTSTSKYVGSVKPGGVANFSDTDSGDSKAHGDNDGSFTALTSITIAVSNPSNLRTIGLFDSNGNQMGSQIDVKALNLTNPSAPQNFNFTGSPLITAPDDSSASFSVRVSFNNTVTTVKDLDNITIQLIAASVGTGSQLFNGNPANSGLISGFPVTFIGGHDATQLTPQSYGLIDVVATSLDFTTQPSSHAGVNEPVGPSYTTPPLPSTSAGIVQARDKFALVDTEFAPVNGSLIGATTGSVIIPATANFVNGVVNLDGIQYTQSGDGTLTATLKRTATGTITTSTGSNSVIGVGTLFLSDLTSGMIIYDQSPAMNVIGTVQSIASNTSLTLALNAAVNMVASPYIAELNSSKANRNTSGTISSSTGSASVTGTATTFTTDLAVGSIINDINGTRVGTVASIGSNTALTLSSNATIALSSAPYNTNSIFSAHVDVLDVTVTYDGSHGVVTPTVVSPPGASLKGGITGYNIFGLKFTATNTTVGSEPFIKGFTINFDVPYESAGNPTFKNFVVKLVNSSGTFDIPTWSKSGPSSGVYDKIIVDLSSNAQSLGAEPNKSISFFLYADVDAKVNLSTSPITPYFSDSGYANPANADNTNSLVSNGTSHGAFVGNKYSFASTQPPVLLTSKNDLTFPYSGQPNVDPYLSQITLQFNTNVASFDNGGAGNAELWSRSTSNKVADLIFDASQAKASVQSNNTVDNTYPTLLYDVTDPNNYGQPLPTPLNADEVYYVKLNKGNYDAVNQTGSGITDFGLNFYGGISSNSVLYFKISSAAAPKLSNAQSAFNTTSIGTLTTNFDQFGTAFYLIVKAGSPVPTAAEVADPSPNTYLTNHGLLLTPGVVGANGSYAITAINADQTYTFAPSNFVANQAYDVYIIAQNDAVAHGVPNPVVASGVYGSASATPKYGAGAGAGPTTTIAGSGTGSIAGSATTITPNLANSNFLICPDSYYTITSPIIIAETQSPSVVSFAQSYVQDFNILLPTGYQYDVTVTPNVQLFGADFVPISGTTYWKFSYTSNTVLNISFNNTTSANPNDFIVISGLSILGKTGSSQGNLQWFYGKNVFTNAASPTFSLGTIALQSVTPVDFVNSYWQSNRALFNAIEPVSTQTVANPAGDALDKTVNAIPDDYKDPIFPGQVQLIPDSRTFGNGDYLASIFSGSGVSGDLFTLNSVATGAAFNITVSHTDLNGCTTQKAEQYLVYDHRNTISNKLGTAYPSPSTLAGTQQTIFNPNWPGASPSIVSQVLNDNELAGYTLQKLVLDLPASEIALNQAIPSSGTQLMSGSAWRNLIQTSVLTAGNDPNTGALFYTWDYAKILNAPTATVQASLDPNIIQNTLDPNLVNAGASDVYDYFRTKKLSPQKNTYWTGGSLGKIEFTGIYRSTADNSVYAPFRQNVELFVPAVPVVEVISPIPTIDASDVTTGVAGVTVQSLGATGKVYNNLYPGTSVFCEQGGTISINGYPSATPGVSSGGFGIYNYASYDFSKVILPSGIITVQKSATTVLGSNTKFTTELVVGATLFDPQGNPIGQIGSIANDTQLSLAVASPLSVTTSSFRANLNVPIPNNANGFVDNQNGSMTLDPVKINNTYKDMLITYTYQENTSPAYGIGYLVIRVTPNPVPAFTIASALANPGSSIFSASCAGNPVLFDANSSTIGGAKSSPSNANYIANYTWDFGDPGSGSPNQPSLIAGTPGGPGATPTGHPQIPNQYVQSLAPQAQYFDMPVHIFTTSNTYTVNLSLTSNWRCPSTATATIINPATQASDLLYAGSSGAIKVGENPEPSFTMAKNCVGDQITFDASASKMPSSTSNSQIQNWNWNYNYQFAGNPYNANNLPNPVPATSSLAAATGSLTVYSQAGFYDVQLTTISTLGCQKSIDKPISQLAVTIPFNQYFDANDGGWQIVDLNTKNNPQGTYTPVPAGTTNPNVSWSWGNTTGRATNGYNSANALWSTSATKIPTNPPTIVNGQGSYYAGEASAIFSPCLNLDQTIVPRPMLSYSGFVDVATGDGLVLQYSTDDYNILDPNKNWTILGTEGSGLDWYTSQALPSSPGTNAHNTTGLGWSGNGIDGNPPPTSTKHTWIHPKHALDAVATLAGTKKVILRFAFASTNSNTYNKDGVSIDSVFFGSRTRTILFENFTSTDAAGNNVLSGQIKSDNDYIRAFVQNNITSTQLVDINYHVGFVGQDPFNADNMSDPSARALYYGVKNIPYAFLDGHHHSGTGADSALFTTWGQAQYDLNTLKLAQADFNNSVTVNPDGSLKIDVNFTPLFDLPSGVGQTTLQIAVLEKSITTDPGYGKITTGETSFEYVLKKMLPNAIGTQFTTPIVGPTPGSTPSSPPVYHPISVGTFNYIPKNLHSNELTVVIFLQNETTKEVYQADLIDNLTVNNVVTGIEPTAENIKLYPNPADQELTIELPSPVKETTTLRLANQWGQFTEMSSFSEGEQKKTISTRDLAEGVYILQLGGNNNAVRAKVVVVHK